MTELGAISRRRFRCDFCNHPTYYSESACRRHEYKCYKNPNRHCLTCKDTGREEMGIPDMEPKYRDCESCKIAHSAGGKCFIKYFGIPLSEIEKIQALEKEV